MKTTRLVIVRHGQTSANSSGLLHGWTDLPLDSVGEEQARSVAARLSREMSADAVLSSPLLRARATAQAIADAFSLPVTESMGLREMHFGDLEGSTMQQLLAKYPNIAAQALDPLNTTLQWPNGERIADFHRRSSETFASIAADYAGKTVIVVSHNGVIGSYLSHLIGHPPNDWRSYKLTNCGITIVQVTGKTAEIVVRNDCLHLGAALSPFDEADLK